MKTLTLPKKQQAKPQKPKPKREYNRTRREYSSYWVNHLVREICR